VFFCVAMALLVIVWLLMFNLSKSCGMVVISFYLLSFNFWVRKKSCLSAILTVWLGVCVLLLLSFWVLPSLWCFF
jgi:hypothetical protein